MSHLIKIRKAYAFLLKAENEKHAFTFAEFTGGSGWADPTARANLTKKLSQHVIKTDSKYRAVGVKDLTEEAFCRLCSQKNTLATDPSKPILSPQIEGLVVKARDSALAAVQHYNNPTAVFRSGNYIILIVIAILPYFTPFLNVMELITLQ